MFCTLCQKEHAPDACPQIEARLAQQPAMIRNQEYLERIRSVLHDKECLPPMLQPSSNPEHVKITLLHATVDGVEVWRWQREDGQWVSPPCSTLEFAYYLAGRMPFLTDAQWKELHPLPKEPLPPGHEN
jgi:hypothetical protein